MIKPITKSTTVAGKSIFVSLASKSDRIPGQKRAEKRKPTRAEVDTINQRNAERALSMILNTNFIPWDYHMVYTYAEEEPTKEQAKKDREKFCRELNAAYKKKGIVLKYVIVTEYKHKRIHHHMVMSQGLSVREIQEIWGKGKARPTCLDQTGDYRRLASYLIKETSKTFREDDAVSRRRYSCSRTIVRPETRKEDVAASHLFEDPKPLEGYYIDQDSIIKGTNPVTGRPYLEYVMISLAEEPRIKKWNRGKKTRNTAPFDSWLKREREKQIEIDLEPAKAGILW